MKGYLFATLLTMSFLHAGPAVAADEHPHAHESAPQLSLNDGQKWVADKHTADSVASMRSAVAASPAKAPAAPVTDLRALGTQLQEQLQTLIRGCTMTGAAHDQLHTWITLLAPEIQALIKTEQPATGHATLEKISGLLVSFNEHFAPAPQPE